jgi:hypothetical protein
LLAEENRAQNQSADLRRVWRIPFFYWGVWCVLIGVSCYFLAVGISIVRLILLQKSLFVPLIERLLWISGVPSTLGLALIALDLGLLLPAKRRLSRRPIEDINAPLSLTVALTAYNDEASIGPAVRDFLRHPLVKRVIVVSNNSSDETFDRAREAGAIVHNETKQGYGRCVYRCFEEALRYEDTPLIALCEGDMTFRGDDLDKFLAYVRHAEIVNGTRIVEQLREYDTQLSTFMYYGNFFAGKLLEAKHLGCGTFTDVGTTYKVMRRAALEGLMPRLDDRVNLEFNAHFLDRALGTGSIVLECPVSFHARVGESKGGNVNNLRALRVGVRMIWGLSFGWKRLT